MSAGELSNTFNVPSIAGKKIENLNPENSSQNLNKALSNSVFKRHLIYKEFQERF
jgi:hypothetical protein